MDAGKLNKRIAIQERTNWEDAIGGQNPTWTNVFATPDGKIAAGINPVSAREIFAAQAMQSEVSHKITVRYRSQLENTKNVASMRVVYGSRIFNIAGAINRNESNQFIDLLCTEGTNDG